MGSLPTIEQTTPDLGTPPAPSTQPSTNPLFTAAEQLIPSTVPTTRASEFEKVLQPFTAQAFATGIAPSHANIGPMAIAVRSDGSVITSGGAGRNQLFSVSREGGKVDQPLATLPYPVFDLAFDSNGNLWGTTGGGPLLQLNPQTGEIIKQYADSITQTLAIQPGTGMIYVSSGNGIEIFNPTTATFTHYSDIRVGNMAFDLDGKLWAATWPQRGDIIRFDDKGKAQKMLHLDTPADSIAFGMAGSKLEGLLESTVKNLAGLEMSADYTGKFTAISDFLPFVDFKFSNPRSNRADKTISYDVTITSKVDYDLQLPLLLLLDPKQNFNGVPLGVTGQDDTGAYLLDLSNSLPDGRLHPGQAIAGKVITINNPDRLRVEFAHSIYALPTPNQAPTFTSTPVTAANAGQAYTYQATANDPDGVALAYLLYDAPEGMAVDATTGLITWNPTANSAAETAVVLRVYDSRGGYATQNFTIQVAGGNHKPIFTKVLAPWKPLHSCMGVRRRRFQSQSHYRLGVAAFGVLLFCTFNGTVTVSNLQPCTHNVLLQRASLAG